MFTHWVLTLKLEIGHRRSLLFGHRRLNLHARLLLLLRLSRAFQPAGSLTIRRRIVVPISPTRVFKNGSVHTQGLDLNAKFRPPPFASIQPPPLAMPTVPSDNREAFASLVRAAIGSVSAPPPWQTQASFFGASSGR